MAVLFAILYFLGWPFLYRWIVIEAKQAAKVKTLYPWAILLLGFLLAGSWICGTVIIGFYGS